MRQAGGSGVLPLTAMLRCHVSTQYTVENRVSVSKHMGTLGHKGKGLGEYSTAYFELLCLFE